MNIASIDIGSNTVLLLIAKVNPSDNSFSVIRNEYEAPRLGRGLLKNGNISEESIDRLMSVMKKYRDLIDSNNCSKVLCSATNAMRIAKNSDLIISKIKNDFQIDVEVISGDCEAELTFLGAASTLADENKKIVLDIGGGSTEIIFGNRSKLFFKKSFPIGAVSLTEQFVNDEIPSKDEINEMYEHSAKVFSEIRNVITTEMPLIAVAGTPTSLSAINQGLTDYDETKVEGSILTQKRITEFIEQFSQLTPNQILNKFGKMLSGREDVILAGSIILSTVTKLTQNDEVFVSGRGIRYGLLMDYLNDLSKR